MHKTQNKQPNSTSGFLQFKVHCSNVPVFQTKFHLRVTMLEMTAVGGASGLSWTGRSNTVLGLEFLLGLV
jgi:hypothetical protein